MRLSFDDEESFKDAAGGLCFNNNPSSDGNPNVHLQVGSMLPQEMDDSEDICFNNPPSDPDTVGSSSSSTSSTPPQERSEDTSS